MKKHIFTFGRHHKYADRHQVIYASYPDTAATKMFKVHGLDWAFQYTEEAWEQSKAEGYFNDNLPLGTIYYCEEEKY